MCLLFSTLEQIADSSFIYLDTLPRGLQGEWSRGLGVAIRIGKFQVQTLLGAWRSLGAQPHYDTLGDPRVEIV